MRFDTGSWLNSSGSSGGGSFGTGGNSFGSSVNPSWNDSFKYDGGFPSGSGNMYGSGVSTGIGTDSDTWAKGFNLKGNDPFGLDKDKKQYPWEKVFEFAGQKLNSYAQNRYGQGNGSSGFSTGGGGGGVSQNGDLTIVYPQASQVIPGQKSGIGSTIGSIAGAAIGSLIAPGIGTSLGGSLGGAAGSFFG